MQRVHLCAKEPKEARSTSSKSLDYRTLTSYQWISSLHKCFCTPLYPRSPAGGWTRQWPRMCIRRGLEVNMFALLWTTMALLWLCIQSPPGVRRRSRKVCRSDDSPLCTTMHIQQCTTMYNDDGPLRTTLIGQNLCLRWDPAQKYLTASSCTSELS